MTPQEIARLRDTVRQRHYTHSVPSGKSWWYEVDEAIVVFSIPPNPFVSTYLLGVPNKVLELARLWAPDGHDRNLLTRAISVAVGRLRAETRAYDALVSYADPNVGHEGFVYRAASWLCLGPCEESRYYRDAAGQVVSRRKFHSGNRHLKKAEIEALGYEEIRRPGKIRFARPLTRQARRAIQRLTP